MHASHAEDTTECKIPSIEYFLVLQEFADVFQEVLGLPPKRYIYFCIDLVPGDAPISKATNRIGTLELKELQIKLE